MKYKGPLLPIITISPRCDELWFLRGSCSPLDRVLFAYCSPPGEGKAFKRRRKPL